MGDRNRQSSDSECMSWPQFWTYIKSDLVSSSDRSWTMRWMKPHLENLGACLPVVQFDILEHAPKVIVQHYANILDPDVVKRLLPDYATPVVVKEQPKREMTLAEVNAYGDEATEHYFANLTLRRKEGKPLYNY